MKLLSLTGLIALAFLFTSMKSTTEVAAIHWTSKSYTDQRNGVVIHMANEFTCTRDGVTWSLFGKGLPVIETKWNISGNLTGTIIYVVAGDNLTGTLRFDFNRKRADVELQSEVGLIQFEMIQDRFHTEFKK